MSEEQDELFSEFLSESDGYLQDLNDKMLDIEGGFKSGSEIPLDALNCMFRAAHTIKGTASFLGFNKIITLTHKMETLLQKLRDKAMGLTEEIVDALFSSFDTLTLLLGKLRESGIEEGIEIKDDVKKIEDILNGTEIKPAEQTKTEEQGNPESTKPPVGRTINEKYLEQFVTEIEGNIDRLNEFFLIAEKEKDNLEVVNELFRIMHTIKGSAGIVNVYEMGEVAHKMETILSFYREQKMPLAADTISLMFTGVDMISGLNNSLKKTRSIDTDISNIAKELDDCYIKISNSQVKDEKKSTQGGNESSEVDFEQLSEIRSFSENEKNNLLQAFQKDYEIFILGLSISEAITVKAMKVALIEERLKKNGIIISFRPSPETIDAAKAMLNLGIVYGSPVNENDIRQSLSLDGVSVESIERMEQSAVNKIIGTQSKKDEKISGQMLPLGQSEQNSGLSQQKSAQGRASSGVKTAPVEVSIIKIDSRKLDDLMNFSGELVIIKAQFARLVNLFKNEIVQQKSSIQINEHFRHSIDVLSKEIETYSSFENKAKTVKIKKIISELSELANLANENILKSNIVENIHSIDETTGALEKVSSNIQAGIMQTRMVPVEGVFTRFKRIVRDISKKIGKDVNLVIEGAETELDKKIVDELGDPLTHMIRNAVGHGMEDKEERAKTGKPLTGSVFLRASHKGNNICIEIGDDGRGVDTEKLVASAIRKGLVTQEDADKMNEKEKLNIMFMPGFSTAQEVTGLSGRGVGMDVVKNMINSVNGVVDINTEIGKGTTFALKIPLTLAIIQSLLVAVGEEIYAFPLDSVVEIINIFDQDIYSINGNPMVKLRGHALSLISLERAIKVKGSHKQGNDAKKVVIITDGENKVGVIVDCLIGKDEIVIKSFSEHFSNVLGLTGASILADGSVALILDPAAIIKEVK